MEPAWVALIIHYPGLATMAKDSDSTLHRFKASPTPLAAGGAWGGCGREQGASATMEASGTRTLSGRQAQLFLAILGWGLGPLPAHRSVWWKQGQACNGCGLRAVFLYPYSSQHLTQHPSGSWIWVKWVRPRKLSRAG